jgi:hypothetical protein
VVPCATAVSAVRSLPRTIIHSTGAPGEIIEELRHLRDPTTLPAVMLSIRDVDAGEVQYDAIELAESFSVGDYVSAVLENWTTIHEQAPRWFELMFTSILNSAEHRRYLLQWIAAQGVPSQAAFDNYLHDLAARRPQYAGVVSPVKGRSHRPLRGNASGLEDYYTMRPVGPTLHDSTGAPGRTIIHLSGAPGTRPATRRDCASYRMPIAPAPVCHGRVGRAVASQDDHSLDRGTWYLAKARRSIAACGVDTPSQ